MVRSLVVHIVAAFAGFWLAETFVSHVVITGTLLQLFYPAALLGIMNAIIKPILNAITLPLRLLTLGLSGLLISMALVWFIDIIFIQIDFIGIIPLFWTTLLVWGAGVFLNLFSKGIL